MPVVGGPTPYHQTLFPPRPNATVREAVAELADLFPRPHSFATSLGFNLRKRRLAMELAELDFLHRLRRGQSASVAQLYRVGEAMITQRKRGFPAGPPRLDEPLLVNTASFARLAEIAAPDQHPDRRRNDP